MQLKPITIGIFYDGCYFNNVSNYYNLYHERQSRLSIVGINKFIINLVAFIKESPVDSCKIIESHLFRGRVMTDDLTFDNLPNERKFEDLLIRENITTHYLPLVNNSEKGIDVLLALETYELALNKKFDIVVLIAGDGDYIPLIRKLHTLETTTILLGWNFNGITKANKEYSTFTNKDLTNEVILPVMMSDVINHDLNKLSLLVKSFILANIDSNLIDSLFVNNFTYSEIVKPISIIPNNFTKSKPIRVDDSIKQGFVTVLKTSDGFIKMDNGNNIFFYYSELKNVDSMDLREGDKVEFKLGTNRNGAMAKQIYKVN